MNHRMLANGAAILCAVALVTTAWSNAQALGTRGPAHAKAMHGEPK